MKKMLHHVAISVTNYEWYIHFFKEVFDMHSYREKGAFPNRSIWFAEGIQLDELAPGKETDMYESFPSHLGFQTDNLEDVLAKAYALGCTQYLDKHHWFVLPDGLKIEIKEQPSIVLDVTSPNT